jgi:glycosyltransferase involved in cell wall biosynthesis
MIVQSTYPDDQRVRREAEALDGAGVQVDIICLRRPGEAKEERWGAVVAHRVCAIANKEDMRQYLLLAARFSFRAFLKVQALCARHRYDVIQAHNMPDFLIFVPFIQKMAGAKLVLDLHDLSVELLESKWGGARARTLLPLVRGVERLSCAFADELITTSSGFLERMIERGISPEKVTLVLNTPDEGIFEFEGGRRFVRIDRGAKLLYHGTVQERFGLLEAIEALGRLQARVPESHLQLFGNYEPRYLARLKDRVRDLALDDYVHFGGYVSPETIYAEIKRADVGLVPYHGTEFMNLALSNKTFEYAAAGLPIVASRLRSIESLFNDECVRYARPEDPDDLARKIEELCADPEGRKRQAVAARRVLGGISWRVMATRYIAVLRRLSTGRQAA